MCVILDLWLIEDIGSEITIIFLNIAYVIEISNLRVLINFFYSYLTDIPHKAITRNPKAIDLIKISLDQMLGTL